MELFDQLPEGVVCRCTGIDVRLLSMRHPFEAKFEKEITENWKTELSSNPRLFNGRVTLASAVSLLNGILQGVTHEIDFATFLFWRKMQRIKGCCHIFAFAVPVTRDAALVAVKMSNVTANPGRVYFAAGSFEKCDFIDGQMNFAANTHREVFEETGLSLDDVPHEAEYGLIRIGAAVLIFRRYHLNDDAEVVAQAICEHVSVESEPEIEGPVIIRKGEKPTGALRHMPVLLDWHFGGGFAV
jgi:8-oxo-dGTP pyrophosphatase MutT (NUDIX family)